MYDSSIPRRSGREIAYDGDEPAQRQTLRSGPHSLETHDYRDKARRPLSTHNFHDGRPVLPGFVLSDKPVAEDTWFVSLHRCRVNGLSVFFHLGSRSPMFRKAGRLILTVSGRRHHPPLQPGRLRRLLVAQKPHDLNLAGKRWLKRCARFPGFDIVD